MLKLLLCCTVLFLHVKAALPPIDLTQEELSYIEKKDVYKLCVDPQSSPFEEITEQGVYKGITADLVEKVARRIGIVLEV